MVSIFHCSWRIWITDWEGDNPKQERFGESEKEVRVCLNSWDYWGKWFYYSQYDSKKIVFGEQTGFVDFQTFKIVVYKKVD